MSAGVVITKANVDNTIGGVTSQLNAILNQVQELKRWVDTKVEADFVTMGYTAEEYAVIASAMSDLDQLRKIYEGLETLAIAKDFTTFARQLYGFGI